MAPKTLRKKQLPADIRNELRRTGAIMILNSIYTKKTMKRADIENVMYNSYHGE
jgi:hypothetical protein